MPRLENFDRTQILKEAMNVFWKKGYNGTSMQDLVDATGLNRSSIYNSFDNKMKFYQIALKAYQNDTGSFFQKILIQSKTPLQAIENVFSYHMNQIIEDQDYKGCFNMNCKSEMANHNEAIRTWLETTQEQTLQFFQDLVKQGQDEGLINNKQSCRDYAYYLFNAFQGFRMTGILVKERKVLRTIIENTITTLK